MTRVHVDYLMANTLMSGQIEGVDDLDASIAAVPVTADAGIAFREIQFVLTAVLESSAVASETMRALYGIAKDAMVDLAVNDQDIADKLKDFEQEALGA